MHVAGQPVQFDTIAGPPALRAVLNCRSKLGPALKDFGALATFMLLEGVHEPIAFRLGKSVDGLNLCLQPQPLLACLPVETRI
jgi:hypothetical protein